MGDADAFDAVTSTGRVAWPPAAMAMGGEVRATSLRRGEAERPGLVRSSIHCDAKPSHRPAIGVVVEDHQRHREMVARCGESRPTALHEQRRADEHVCNPPDPKLLAGGCDRHESAVAR